MGFNRFDYCLALHEPSRIFTKVILSVRHATVQEFFDSHLCAPAGQSSTACDGNKYLFDVHNVRCYVNVVKTSRLYYGRLMSYNISAGETIHLDARIKAQDVFDLCEGGKLPEVNFLEIHKEDALFALKKDYREWIELKEFSWHGEGSGSTFSHFVDVIAPKIKGRIDVVFFWEGGDSVDGMSIQDGVVTHCDVDYVLVPRNTKNENTHV